MYEDHDFDGCFKSDLHKATESASHAGEADNSSQESIELYSGYITLNGEFDDPQYFYNDDEQYYIEEDFYGGIYLHDSTVIIVYTTSSSERKREAIDSLLTSFDYPVPPTK